MKECMAQRSLQKSSEIQYFLMCDLGFFKIMSNVRNEYYFLVLAWELRIFGFPLYLTSRIKQTAVISPIKSMLGLRASPTRITEKAWRGIKKYLGIRQFYRQYLQVLWMIDIMIRRSECTDTVTWMLKTELESGLGGCTLYSIIMEGNNSSPGVMRLWQVTNFQDVQDWWDGHDLLAFSENHSKCSIQLKRAIT